MAKRRRAKRYGAVRRNRAKVRRALDREPAMSRVRSVNVIVKVFRSIKKRGVFAAKACVGKYHEGAGRGHCAPVQRGTTPTAAVKKALAALGRNIK